MNGRSAEVVIVGAGVMGASIAFHLALRKAGRVIVVDKADVGHGGSGRSSALVRMHYSFPPEVRLAVKSLEIFRAWSEIVGRPGDLRVTGFVRLVPGGEADRLRRNVEMQRSLGVNAEVIGPRELQELEPDWNVDDVVAAAYEPESGYGDGAGVASDFLARAREMGVEYRSATGVTGLSVEGGRVVGVETTAGPLAAPVVVVAAGPWTRPIVAAIGHDLPIETEFHQVAILKNPPGLRGRGLAAIDSMTSLYSRREGRDMTLVGAFYGRRGVDPDACPESASAESLAEMSMGIARRVPRLAEAGLVRGITGVYDMTPDSRPLLGELPGVTGLHVAAGFSGMGFKISPAVGLVMSERILDGCASTVDIAAFRPSRFAEGRPIKATYEYADD
ncbi:MAG TPA: FAD-binding oxidoreductase [Vicinamibacteria bacterium]|jgi:sarcosine oxidase subunit beta